MNKGWPPDSFHEPLLGEQSQVAIEMIPLASDPDSSKSSGHQRAVIEWKHLQNVDRFYEQVIVAY